ncbi:hypothetical protein AB0J74_03690 [Asanoa sp. NPDC049573]|uniref:hypothetical protein n=1 Tax=Asanoa sp. NPDC049573 TaxID=3155396 RepID=UPI00342D86A0
MTLIVLLRVRHDKGEQAEFVVDVTACQFHGSSVAVSLSIRNDGPVAGSARVEWEYRDARGKVVGKDATTVSDTAAGATVRRATTTSLDITTAAGTCEVTSVGDLNAR